MGAKSSSVTAARAHFPRGLQQPRDGFRASVDALLLAHFVEIPVNAVSAGDDALSAPFAPFGVSGAVSLTAAAPSATPAANGAANGVPVPASPVQDATASTGIAAPGLTFVELGTGNATAACALALRCPQAQGVGIEVYAPAVEAARANIVTLGLQSQLTVIQGDIADATCLRHLPLAPQVVLANPPYRAPHAGRACRSPAREQALVEEADTLPLFCRAAATVLCSQAHKGAKGRGGRFCLIYAAARTAHALACLKAQGFGVRRMEAVFTAPHRPARFVLLEARLGCADDIRLTAQYLY